MTQATTPDDERDWDSIDIFLFSNGQEYSPPRKYHLRADELNWWDATLNHLAKSQFGLMHPTIQLYTLDGHRVEGPLELSNGGAYVAVEPPDVFIDSGYDKYLVKASRSWEKRQAKKSSSNEVTQDGVQIAPSDNINTEVNAAEMLTSIKAPEDNVTIESLINPPLKSPNVPDKQQQTPKLSHTTKQVERKRTSVSQRVTTFRKITNPPPTPPAKKLALKSSPPKKFTKPPIRTSNTPQANLLAKARLYAKSVYKTKENIPTDRTKAVEPKSVSSLTRITSNYKMMSTDSTPMDNVIGDKEIILVSDMYKNIDNDSKPIKIDKKEQAGVQCSPEIIRIDEEIQSVIDETAETAHGRVSVQREDVRNNKIRIVNVTPDSNNILNPVDDNYITFMNKGDVVNLRLMIEVRNVDNRNVKYKTVRNSQSVTNITKPQRESGYNMEDEVLIQSKSLQSLLENEYSQSMHTEGDTKVVVVRCGCLQYETENDMSRANGSSMCTCNKRFFILLPKWDDTSDRCKRDEDTKQNSDNCEQKKEESRKSSTVTPVKQIFSELSPEKRRDSKNADRKSRDMEAVAAPINTERKKSRDMGAITDPINTERKKSRDMAAVTEPINTERKKSGDTEAPVSKSDFIPLQAENKNAINGTNSEYGTNAEYTTDEYVVTKHVVTEDQGPQSGVTTGPRSSVVSERTEYIVRRKSSLKEPKTYVENCTQTENSDILLEARRHEDGRYTFHLPSLYTLKTYQL